jgi:serine protease
MRKSLAATGLAALIGIAVFGSKPVQSQDPVLKTPKDVTARMERRVKRTFVPGEIIVKKKIVAGTPSMVPAVRLQAMGLDSQPRQTSGGELIYRITPAITGAMTSPQKLRDKTMDAVKALRASPEVQYAQPNFVLHITEVVPNDHEFPLQWHYLLNGTGPGRSPGGINLPRVWETNKGSASVVVAVIDTGILPNHPDITGSPNLLPGFDMISDAARANDGDGRDPNPTDTGDAVAAGECGNGEPLLPESSSWHGTHVAGTIGVGKTDNGVGVAGINWQIKVAPVRVLGKCGGSTSDINDAIRWAAGLPVPGVPANPSKARVINMSLGAPAPCSDSPSTQSAIDDAVAAGVLVVVAAGNDAQDAAGSFPASCANVVSVAASDFRGHLADRYSNFGPSVTIMAPGGDVDRDDNHDGRPDGVLSMVDGGYAFYNGTSMAAPHVAGVAALWLAKEPALTPAQVRTRLRETALPRSSADCPRPCGAGLLDASAPGVRVSALPATIDLQAGRSTTLTARVTRAGAPLAGVSVHFSSSNPGVTQVDPATATTNASGQASATVRGLSAGAASVRAEAEGVSTETPVQVSAVRVPDLEVPGVLALAAVLLALSARRSHLERRRGRR